MAFSTRRYVKHIDKYDKTHRLEIQEDGFGGSESSIDTTGQVFQFEHETHASADEEIINVYENPVQKGSIELHLLIQSATDRTLIENIFDGDEDDFRLVWKIDGTIFWTGTILNDMLEYPESDFPYPAKLWAKDFSRLEGVDYTLDDTRQTLITTFADLIGNLGYGLDIETHTSWTNEDTTDSTDFLQQIYHETKALREFGRTGDEEDEPITVFEALEMMCRNFGCVLRQEGGVFKIIQYSEYETPTGVNVTVYDSDGAQSVAATSTDLSLDASTNDIIVTDRSVTKAFKAIWRARVTFDHRSLVTNIQLPGVIVLEGNSDSESFSQLFISNGEQKLVLQGDVVVSSDPLEGGQTTIPIEIESGGHWWDGDDWVESQTNAEIDIGEHGGGTGFIFSYTIETDNVPADADGTLTVTFHSPNVTYDINDVRHYSSFNVLGAIIGEEDTTAIDYHLTQTSSFSVVYDYTDTWYGDGPGGNSPSALRWGAGDGERTADSWQRRGTTSGYRNFHENLLKEIIDPQRSQIHRTDGSMLGADYDSEKILSYRSMNMAYTGGGFDGEAGDWHPVLMEINVQTDAGDTFENILKFTNETGSGTGSAGGSTGGGGGGLSESEANSLYAKQASNASDFDSPSDVRTNLGLEIGDDVQAWSSLLDDVAANDGSADLRFNSLQIDSNLDLFSGSFDHARYKRSGGDEWIGGVLSGGEFSIRPRDTDWTLLNDGLILNRDGSGILDGDFEAETGIFTGGLIVDGSRAYIDAAGQHIVFNTDANERTLFTVDEGALGSETTRLGSLYFDQPNDRFSFQDADVEIQQDFFAQSASTFAGLATFNGNVVFNNPVTANDRLTAANGSLTLHENGYAYYDVAGENFSFMTDATTRNVWDIRRGSVGDTGSTNRLWGIAIADNDDLQFNPEADSRVVFSGDISYQQNITSDNFAEAAGIYTGFDLGQNEFRAETIRANELRVKAFVAEISAALYGEDILTKSRGVLSRDFTVPAVGNTSTLYVEDLEGQENSQVFEAGDWIRLRVVDRSGGGLQVFNVWGKVTSYSDLSGGEQSWTFTRESGGTANTGDEVYEGSIAIDYGTSGDAVIVRSVIGSNTPRDTQLTWTTDPIDANNYSIVTRTGILDDIDNASGAGFYSENFYATNSILVGDLSEVSNYLKYDGTSFTVNADIFNLQSGNLLITDASGDGRIEAGGSTNRVGITAADSGSGGSDSIAFWAGELFADRTVAPIWIKRGGDFNFADGAITGTATSASIDVDDLFVEAGGTGFQSADFYLNSTANQLSLGSVFSADGSIDEVVLAGFTADTDTLLKEGIFGGTTSDSISVGSFSTDREGLVINDSQYIINLAFRDGSGPEVSAFDKVASDFLFRLGHTNRIASAYFDLTDMWGGSSTKTDAGNLRLNFDDSWITDNDAWRIEGAEGVKFNSDNPGTPTTGGPLSIDWRYQSWDSNSQLMGELYAYYDDGNDETNFVMRAQNTVGSLSRIHLTSSVIELNASARIDANSDFWINDHMTFASGAVVTGYMSFNGKTGVNKGEIRLPNRTDATRPSNPNPGELIYNTDAETVQVGNNSGGYKAL